MRNRLVKVVKRIPEESQLVRVSYIWPCFNLCGSIVQVDRQTFSMLENKTLLGVKCSNCLTPPAEGMRSSVAA